MQPIYIFWNVKESEDHNQNLIISKAVKDKDFTGIRTHVPRICKRDAPVEDHIYIHYAEIFSECLFLLAVVWSW